MESLIKVGDSHSLNDVYCQHILEGRLPELIPDTAKEPLAKSMPITDAVPIGSHVSIPIRRPDGSPYGMFCCLSSKPNDTLNERDRRTMKMFADLAARQVHKDLKKAKVLEGSRERITRVMEEHLFSMVYQPIWDFRKKGPIGFESLCRFSPEPYRTPDVWFADAAATGQGASLERTVIQEALKGVLRLPDHCYVSINASPDTVLSGDLQAAIEGLPPERIVLEITEHAPVTDYGALDQSLKPLRQAGVRLAVDDAGAGYASLQHIVQLAPDIIKLDMRLTREVDTNQARRSLAAALIFFARETGASLIAEGIETPTELETLKMLGVNCGQGYLLGRPGDLDGVAELFDTTPGGSMSMWRSTG